MISQNVFSNSERQLLSLDALNKALDMMRAQCDAANKEKNSKQKADLKTKAADECLLVIMNFYDENSCSWKSLFTLKEKYHKRSYFFPGKLANQYVDKVEALCLHRLDMIK